MSKNFEKELSSEETIEQGLNVTLRNNSLDENGSYFASVKTRLANVKAALKLIKDEDKGVDITAVKHGLELYNRQVIRLLETGLSVKVLDLGTLEIKHRGRISGEKEAAALNDFTVEFAPSGEVLQAVQNLSVDAVLTVDNSPSVEGISDLSRKLSDGRVTIGQPMQVTGANLKVSESDAVYLVPQDDDGNDRSADKSAWVLVEHSRIFRNMPSELNFFVPETAEEGSYRLLVSTSYLTASTRRKTALTGRSAPFTVTAA